MRGVKFGAYGIRNGCVARSAKFLKIALSVYNTCQAIQKRFAHQLYIWYVMLQQSTLPSKQKIHKKILHYVQHFVNEINGFFFPIKCIHRSFYVQQSFT